jgi:NAD(P)-dependent dehydrogenase (short-subunit alcohol dehydrogenase family)
MRELSLQDVPADVRDRFRLDRLPLERQLAPTSELLRLDGQCALVTGGGGDGLGNSVCHRLAEQGATVAVLDLDPGAAKASAVEVARRWGTDAFGVAADVGDWDEVMQAVAIVRERAGRIDVLVNNVGGSGGRSRDGARASSVRPLAEMDRDAIDLLVRINLTGALYVTNSVLKSMIAQGRGRIVMVSSEAGRSGVSGESVYSACKAGLIGLTQSLGRELGPAGITTVCVCPGLMVGQRHLEGLRDDHDLGDVLDETFARISLGRASVFDEAAGVIAFLASPAGAYVHATTVSVGGGISG